MAKKLCNGQLSLCIGLVAFFCIAANVLLSKQLGLYALHINNWSGQNINNAANIGEKLKESEIDPLLVYGIITVAEKYDIRMMCRSAYRHQKGYKYGILLRFVVGLPRQNESWHMQQMQSENETFGDLIILNISENMNRGKTWKYFEYIATHSAEFGEYKFVGKYDDDTVMDFANHSLYLQQFRSESDVSYAIICFQIHPQRPVWNISSQDRHPHKGRLDFRFWGLGYGMSTDVMQWITSDRSWAHRRKWLWNGEDSTTTRWLMKDQKGLNTKCGNNPALQQLPTGFISHPTKTYHQWLAQIKSYFPDFMPMPNRSWN